MKPPTDLALELFKKGHDASSKFDYFICSVSGAIFAYTAQNYSPKRLEFDWSLLEPISLLLLALAFYFGIKRIEVSRTVIHINHEIVDCEDKAGHIEDMMKKQNPPPDAMVVLEQKRQVFLQTAKQYTSEIPKYMKQAVIFLKLRDKFLIFGFAAIFLAKVLQPYTRDFLPHSNSTMLATNITVTIVQPAAIPSNMPTQKVTK